MRRELSVRRQTVAGVWALVHVSQLLGVVARGVGASPGAQAS